MTQTYAIHMLGNLNDNIPASDEYLTLNFSPSSSIRKRRWGNYGLSADFLGDYFATFFPGDEDTNSKINRKDAVKAAVSFVANELLENAVKYSNTSSSYPITISLHLYEQKIIFHATNCSNHETSRRYEEFVQELINTDLDKFYTQQLEKTAMGGGGSCMGILTMINDYGAQFCWKFQPVADYSEEVQISVIAHLDV
jgi:hypothetical protein